MPRAGLSPRLVVTEAARLADEVGPDRLTLAMLAKRFGVALPSLYKHVSGLDAVLLRVSALATAELAEEVVGAAVGRARAEALRAVAGAYRGYARRHPGRYLTTQRLPDESDPEYASAAARLLDAVYAILRGYGLDGDDLVDAARMLRSALHGFVVLENGRGFGLPRDLDRSFERMVDGLDAAFQGWNR